MISASTFDMVQREVARAKTLHRDKALTNPDVSDLEKLPTLLEEVGEVARALTYDQEGHGLVEELTQVAACAVSWIEAIKAREVAASVRIHRNEPDGE